MERPDFIKNYREIQEADNHHYPGSTELLSISSSFAKKFGLTRLGIHHELLPPGRRTSYPHAEEDEDEFIYVIEGHPDVWIDGDLHRLGPGDGVGFPHGTGTCHTFINNTESDVRLLVAGEASKKTAKIYYPLNPERREQVGDNWWHDVPQRKMGPHNGIPEKPSITSLTNDDFTRYVILLKQTPNVERDQSLIRKHVEYLRQLDSRGILVLCGPFLDADGGMVIVKAKSIEQAKEIAVADPFVREGARTFEVRTWKLSCEANKHLGMG